MRFLEIINEMNVSNLDTIKEDFTRLLDKLIHDAGIEIQKPLRDLIIKRAVKAMQNDDAGNMVTRQIVQDVPNTAPAWLKTAVQRGDEVYEITFKDGFENRLTHVLDWLKVDPEAGKVIKTAPEMDFLGHLAKAADDFFAKASTQTDKQKHQSLDEPGRE